MPVYTFSEASYKLCLKCLSPVFSALLAESMPYPPVLYNNEQAMGDSLSADSSSRKC